MSIVHEAACDQCNQRVPLGFDPMAAFDGVPDNWLAFRTVGSLNKHLPGVLAGKDTALFCSWGCAAGYGARQSEDAHCTHTVVCTLDDGVLQARH